MASRKKKPALQINSKAKSADPLRDEFGLNSPKTQAVADPAEDTPADNKLRGMVNSPKAGENESTNEVTFNAEPMNAGLASLVTQVERPDASKKKKEKPAVQTPSKPKKKQ